MMYLKESGNKSEAKRKLGGANLLMTIWIVLLESSNVLTGLLQEKYGYTRQNGSR